MGPTLDCAPLSPDFSQLGHLFNTEGLVPTFWTLSSRGCLPADFNAPDSATSRACAGSIESLCPAVPMLALFYVCIAESRNFLDDTSFNVTAFDNRFDSNTDDATWLTNQRSLSSACQWAADASLTPKQQAVFAFTCWKFSMFLDCDLRECGVLSGVASCRRARFLAGTCPLSPRTLLTAFGPVGSRWQQCSGGETISVVTHTETECRELDVAALRIFSCMLQDFTNDDGTVNFDSLSSAIGTSAGDHFGRDELLEIVEECGSVSSNVTEFVTCWTKQGIVSCARSEANQLALQLHEQPC